MTYPVIRVQNISKRYRIGTQKASYGSLRESISEASIKLFNTIRFRNHDNNFQKNGNDYIWALKNVSIDVDQGEVLGIIGRNGAGKSTLLKIISRITKPTEGRIHLRGRVGSLLEVGTGFHPELTGKENIFLNGAILGMKRREIERKFDEIVSFAEIEKFLDTPVKFYSSGMYMRLAFSVAAHLESEVLLIDEVLAVGDLAFQNKCLGKMEEVTHKGRTVMFVSHNMSSIKALCNKGVYLEKGKISYHGNIEKCIDEYLNIKKISEPILRISENSSLPVQIREISIVGSAGNLLINHPNNEPFWIKLDGEIKSNISNIYFAVHIHDNELNTLLFSRDFESNPALLGKREIGKFQYLIKIPPSTLNPSIYTISVHIAQSTPAMVIDRYDYICPFEIIDPGSIRASFGFPWVGKVAIPLEWEYKNE